MSKFGILNFTELTDDTVFEVLQLVRAITDIGDASRKERIIDDERNMSIWRKELWTEEDKATFELLGLSPYEIQYHRPLFQSLIAAQRRNRFKFNVVPIDTTSFRRYKAGKDTFVEDKIADGTFHSRTDAAEYYDSFADDKYAKAITAYLQVARNENKATDVENDCFENGIITGADFLKCIFSNKRNREGGIEISRVPQRAMFWDVNSVQYDLSDSEYIGEVHVLYKDDLKKMYPAKAEEIEEHFKQYTNKSMYRNSISKRNYSEYYDINTYTSDSANFKIKVVELYTFTTEPRFIVNDLETGDRRMSKHDATEDSIWDMLLNVLLDEEEEYAQKSGDTSRLENPNIKEILSEEALTRYSLEQVYEPVWFKTVFTHDVVFEYTRVEDHPYTPYFPQFTQGYFTSVMSDVRDLIIALNKAYMFRELLMGHSAKGLLVVDQDTLAASNYSLDDIAEQYTQIGGVIALKLKAGKTLDKVFYSKDTMASGLQEITLMIRDYEAKLEFVIGVNRAQLGINSSEAPTSRMRLELAQGQGNNSVVFDNFSRTLRLYYEKVIKMVAELMKRNPKKITRSLGDQYNEWLEYEIDEEFDLFVSAVREGLFSLTLTPIEEDPQQKHSREAQYMQLAMAGGIPIEVALEYSSDPNRFDIIRKIRQSKMQAARDSAYQQIEMQQVAGIATQLGLPPATVDELISKMRIQKIKELNSADKQNPNAQGASEIQRAAKEPMRQEAINQSQQA